MCVVKKCLKNKYDERITHIRVGNIVNRAPVPLMFSFLLVSCCKVSCQSQDEVQASDDNLTALQLARHIEVMAVIRSHDQVRMSEHWNLPLQKPPKVPRSTKLQLQMSLSFQTGEQVLCFHGPLLYEAKVGIMS